MLHALPSNAAGRGLYTVSGREEVRKVVEMWHPAVVAEVGGPAAGAPSCLSCPESLPQAEGAWRRKGRCLVIGPVC